MVLLTVSGKKCAFCSRTLAAYVSLQVSKEFQLVHITKDSPLTRIVQTFCSNPVSRNGDFKYRIQHSAASWNRAQNQSLTWMAAVKTARHYMPAVRQLFFVMRNADLNQSE